MANTLIAEIGAVVIALAMIPGFALWIQENAGTKPLSAFDET